MLGALESSQGSMIFLTKLFLYFGTFFVTAWLMFFGLPAGYEYAVFMPAAYLFFVVCVLKKGEISISRPFIMIILTVGAFRYVIQPVLISYTGGYEGRSWVEPSLDSYRAATLLMVYELVAVSIFIYFYQRKKKPEEHHQKISGETAPLIVSSFAFLASSFLIIINPESLAYISFFVPNPLAKFQDVVPSFVTKFSASSFIITKQIFAIGLLAKIKKKYEKSRDSKYKIYAVVVALGSVFIYFGVSRIDFLVSAFSMYAVYKVLFGSLGYKKIILGLVALLLMFGYITDKREYNTVARSASEKTLEYAQAYTGGVYNVAIGLEVKEWFPEASSLKVLLFDFVRPIIGINVLVKHLDIKYSNMYFNDRMWTHVERRSQIMPMLAQSNLYFGYLFAPLLTVLFVLMGLKLSDYAGYSANLEMKYFATFCAARFGVVFGQNSMNLLNELSFSFIMPALMVAFFILIKRVMAKK